MYGHNGGVVPSTPCDENGNSIGAVTGPGDEEFYLAVNASALENAGGVSRVVASQRKLQKILRYYEEWRINIYYNYNGPDP